VARATSSGNGGAGGCLSQSRVSRYSRTNCLSNEGWAWPDLDRIHPRQGGATRAQIDALKLLAVFVQHSDSKPDQQETVCEEGRSQKDAKGNETCRRAWLVIKDLGATFGKATRLNSSKMNLHDWDSVPVWKVGGRCVGDLPRSMTGSLEDPVISEPGRRFLANRLAQLRDRQIRDLFVVSQIQRRGEEITGPDGRKRRVTVDDWVRVFKQKRAEIAAARCGGGPGSPWTSCPLRRAGRRGSGSRPSSSSG